MQAHGRLAAEQAVVSYGTGVKSLRVRVLSVLRQGSEEVMEDGIRRSCHHPLLVQGSQPGGSLFRSVGSSLLSGEQDELRVGLEAESLSFSWQGHLTVRHRSDAACYGTSARA